MSVSSYLNAELERLRGELSGQAHEVIQLRADLATAQDRVVKAEEERERLREVVELFDTSKTTDGATDILVYEDQVGDYAIYRAAMDGTPSWSERRIEHLEAELTAAREEIRHLHTLLTHTPIGTQWREAALARLKIIDRLRAALEKAPCGCTCPIHHHGWHSSGHCLAWWDGERNGECERVFCTRCIALELDKVKGEPDAK